MDYIAHLSKDKRFKKLFSEQAPFQLKREKNICIFLCASIMSQQLSTRVAAVIHQRFLDLYESNEPTPEQILQTPLATLRAIGLSHAKTNYVHNVARFALEYGMDYKRLQKMENEEIINYLTRIKGSGK